MEALNDDELSDLLGPELDVSNALRLAQQLDSTRSDVGVIIVAEPNPEMLHAALLAGARDVWSPDAAAQDLLARMRTNQVLVREAGDYLLNARFVDRSLTLNGQFMQLPTF